MGVVEGNHVGMPDGELVGSCRVRTAFEEAERHLATVKTLPDITPPRLGRRKAFEWA